MAATGGPREEPASPGGPTHESGAAWARRSAATLRRRLRRERQRRYGAESAAEAAERVFAGSTVHPVARQVLTERLTLLGTALLQHWLLDEVNQLHAHRHADALRYASSFFDPALLPQEDGANGHSKTDNLLPCCLCW